MEPFPPPQGPSQQGTSQQGSPSAAVPAELVRSPAGRPAAARRSSLRVLLLLFLLLVLVGSVLLNFALLAAVSLTSSRPGTKIQETFFSHDERGGEKVAILMIQGTILSGDGFVKRQIDHARQDFEDGNLKALVVRVDSPGGTVTGSDYIYHHLNKLREETGMPVVVSMGGVAASGGYYVSMAVGDTPRAIFAEPTTWTGSIGVIMPRYDLSQLLGKWGVEEDSIASGPLKNMGSFAQPMTEEERQIFRELVDDSFERFKEVIRSGRPEFQENPGALDRSATGQIFTARQAKDRGLIDEIGYIEAAIDRVIELAGLDKDDVKVVQYKPEPTLMDVLMGAQAARQPAWDMAALLDMTTPRAYYLCTTLPALGVSGAPNAD